MRPAVELSYLPKEQQQALFDTMELEDCTPSHAQAIKMRKFAEEGKLNEDVILSIMTEEKPNQVEQFKIPKKRIDKYFSPGTTPKQMEDTIIKALELYRRRREDGKGKRTPGGKWVPLWFPFFRAFRFPLPTPYPFRITSSLPAEKKNKEPVAIHIPPDQYPALPASRDFLCGPKGSEMEENEVKKIKQLFKKGIALALAAVTTLSVLPAATVSAASERATITFDYCYDGNGNTIRYQQTVSHDGITCGHAGEARTRIYADGENAYCIEPGISLHTGNTLEKDASVAWHNLGKEKQDAVNLALLYGAQGSMGSLSGTEDEKVLATQMVIWEIVTGCRNATAPYARTDAKFYNSLCVGGQTAVWQRLITRLFPAWSATEPFPVLRPAVQTALRRN